MENKEPKRTANFSPNVSGDEYQPYVPATENIKEFTVRAIVIGCILWPVFSERRMHIWR